MKRRRDSLAKILLLQDQLQKLSTWKLAALDQKRAALVVAQQATIAAIDHDAMTHRLLVASATRHLRGIDNQIEAVKVEHAAQSSLAREQARRAKLAERMFDRADVAYRAHQDRIDLSELIERSIAKAGASSA
jgi:hypothetical protein